MIYAARIGGSQLTHCNHCAIPIWEFPKIGVPPIHFSRFFHYKASSYWGTPMTMETPISSKFIHSVGCPSVVHPLLRGIFDTQVAHAQLELLAGRPAYQASATELLLRLDVIGRSPRKNSLVFRIVIIDYYCQLLFQILFFFLSGLLLLILDFRRNSWPFSWISLSDLIQVFVQIFVLGRIVLITNPSLTCAFRGKKSDPYPIGSMYGVYANTGGILMGSMLPYMAAPWIRHGYWSHGSARTLWKTTHRTGRLLRTYLGVESEAPDLKSLMLQDHRLSEQAP